MRKVDILFFGIIIVLLIGIVFLIHLLKSETAQCIKNPYVYGAKKMGEVFCDCSQYKNPLCPAKFYFNDTSFNPVVNYCGTRSASPDFSNINISFNP